MKISIVEIADPMPFMIVRMRMLAEVVLECLILFKITCSLFCMLGEVLMVKSFFSTDSLIGIYWQHSQEKIESPRWYFLS